MCTYAHTAETAATTSQALRQCTREKRKLVFSEATPTKTKQKTLPIGKQTAEINTTSKLTAETRPKENSRKPKSPQKYNRSQKRKAISKRLPKQHAHK